MTMPDSIAAPLRQRTTPAVVRSLSARYCRLIPSVFLFLAISILLLSANVRLLGDPDTMWHVAVGRWIWDHGRVPQADIFSHTFEGQPWIAKEWLSQLIFFGVHRLTGWWGIVMMTVVAVSTSFVILHKWLLRRLHPVLAAVITLVALVLCSVHFVARPHILVLPLMVIWATELVAAADEERAPPLWLALLMALWVNLHGSFPVGLALASALAGESIILRSGGSCARAVRLWAPFLIVSIMATLLSPYGWETILVPLRISGAESLRFIEEWKPLELDIQGSIGLAALVLALGLLARDVRREVVRCLVVAVLGYMMVRHVRFLSTFGIIGAVLVARVLATRWHFGVRSCWEPPVFLVGALIPSLLIVVIYAATIRPAPDAKVAPTAALTFVGAHGVRGPVYNDYNFGGFLIDAGIKTFVDGRTDQLFLGNFLANLETALDQSSDEAFVAILTKYNVRWALVRPHSRDARHLSHMTGWSEVYQDDTAAVFFMGG